MDDEAMTKRALMAYYKTANREGYSADIPSEIGSGVRGAGNRDYVVLANGCGAHTLAVYRIQTNGILKRLRRWPTSLDWD